MIKPNWQTFLDQIDSQILFRTRMHLRRPKNQGATSAFKLRVFFLILLMNFALSLVFSQQQSLDFDRVRSDEAFRDGVVFLHSGRVNDSILAFQRALSFKPDDPLTRIWLGRAYFFGGFEESAEIEWREALRLGVGTPALQSFLETLASRRGFGNEILQDQEFFPTAAFRLVLPGGVPLVRFGDQIGDPPQRFADHPMPGTIALRPDGWKYVANFSQNSVQVYDANGRLRQTFTGGFNGFQGPFGLALMSGNRLAVSSFRGDRIHVLNGNTGAVLQSFGSRGIGPGQFIGPQFLTYDPEGYLFITDYGNQRIHKWTDDGEFVLSFGDERVFHRIGGIAYRNSTLVVLDSETTQGTLRFFDQFGNQLSSFSSPQLALGESIQIDQMNNLLITTPTGILQVFPESRQISQVFRSQDNLSRGFVSGDLDVNGNLILSDARLREILILSRLSGLYSGLHVQINRVMADNFPRVRVEVTVEDRTGAAVLGLDGMNFSVTEGTAGVGDITLIQRGYQLVDLGIHVVIAPSSQVSTPRFQSGASELITQLWQSLPLTDQISIINASDSPQLIQQTRGTATNAVSLISSIRPNPRWALDLALRLSGNLLIRSDSIRHILLVGDGSLHDESFSTFGIEEVKSYLRNNGIRLHFIDMGNGFIDPGIGYLTSETGGSIFSFFGEQNFAAFLDSLRSQYPGRYILEFQSRFDDDFGRRYLPIEVEVRHLTKSGRDETGYFAPLRF
jgi:DNA-binding beta-propeller fold protein YncE